MTRKIWQQWVTALFYVTGAACSINGQGHAAMTNYPRLKGMSGRKKANEEETNHSRARRAIRQKHGISFPVAGHRIPDVCKIFVCCLAPLTCYKWWQRNTGTESARRGGGQGRGEGGNKGEERGVKSGGGRRGWGKGLTVNHGRATHFRAHCLIIKVALLECITRVCPVAT